MNSSTDAKHEHNSAPKPEKVCCDERHQRQKTRALPQLRDSRTSRKPTVITSPQGRADAASKAVKRAKAASEAIGKTNTKRTSASSLSRKHCGGRDAVRITEDRVTDASPTTKRNPRARGGNVPRGERPHLMSQPETMSTSVHASHGANTVNDESDAEHIPKTRYWSVSPFEYKGTITPDAAVGDIVYYQEDDDGEGVGHLTALPSGTVLIEDCSQQKLATIHITLDDSAKAIAERFCDTHGLDRSFAHKYEQFIDTSQQAWQRLKTQLVAAGEQRVAEMKKQNASIDFVEVQLAGPVFPGMSHTLLEDAKKADGGSRT